MPRLLSPEEDGLSLEYGIGLSNLARRATARGDEGFWAPERSKGPRMLPSQYDVLGHRLEKRSRRLFPALGVLIAFSNLGCDDDETPNDPVLDTFPVPLDENDPSKGMVDLAYTLYPARAPESRVGALLVHFGGPGSSAVSSLGDLVDQWSEQNPEIVDRFDIVGFDELGVGSSRPILCNGPYAPYPGTDGGTAALAAAERYAQNCQQAYSELDQLGTNRVIRDIDRFRAFLGEPDLNILGFSYGSMVAMGYAAVFAERARSIVADAIADPRATLAEWTVERARGFDSELEIFFNNCAAESNGCDFGGRDPQGTFDRIIQQLRSNPRPPVFAEEVLSVVSVYLTSPSLRPSLEQLLADVERGNYRRVREVGDLLDTSFTPAAFYGTLCPDRPTPTPQIYARDVGAIETVAPRFGAQLSGAFLPCIYWGAPTDLFDPALEDSEPILLINSLRDPRTLHVWAERVAQRIPGRAFIEVSGPVHGASFRGNPCVDEPVVNYLISGALPDDANCTQ